MSKLNPDNVIYIINKDYLEDYSNEEHRWEKKYLTTSRTSKKYLLMEEPKNIGKSPSEFLKSYVREHQNSIEHYLVNNVNFDNIDAIITWVNNNTLKSYANSNNISIIHNECGPLRSPVYLDTFYFDFSGVNGSTEFNSRFEEFLKISNKLKLFSREELLEIVSPDYYKELIEVLHNKNGSNTGFPSQVMNDTNVLVYNNGWTLIDVLEYTNNKHNNMMIRNHPSSNFTFNKEIYYTSLHEHCYEFINECSKIITLNSSVGFEALLLDKYVEFLGESPFSNIPYYDEDIQLKALNFAIISYLIPNNCLFNEDYYKFRLTCFDEEKLYNKGLELWKVDKF